MVTIANAVHGDFMVFPNDSLGKSLLQAKDFEPHFYNVVKNVVNPGSVCIDAGANLGYHTVTLGKLVGPSGKIIAIEPQRIIYQQLNGNVFLNGLRNVTCINAAITNRSGDAVRMDGINYDSFGINIGATKIGNFGESVQTIKLDDVITSGVDFIKIDIQGSEVMLLDGATELIHESRPIMFVEVEDVWLNCFGVNSTVLLNKILDLNYTVMQIMNEYPCDHLAIPKEKSNLIPHIIKDIGWPITTINRA